MGYHTYESYTLMATLSNQSPADSSTILCGYPTFLNATSYPIYVPRTGIIKTVYITWYNTVNCTAEDTTLTIRKNNTSDSSTNYTGSFQTAQSPQTFEANLPVTKGDYIHLKIVSPAWVTNPTGVYLCWTVEIVC